MTKPNSGKSAINKHMNKIQNTKDEPCYSDGRGQFGHSFYEGEDKCMYCGKSRTTTTDKPMNQIDKLKEEFEKLFEHVAYELDGNKYLALNLNLNPEEIWNWHISEMEKLLERVRKEKNRLWDKKENELHGGYDDTDWLQAYESALSDIDQSLNKLKEEIK